MPEPAILSKRFRVAFSFAGERRTFVAQVADILAEKFSQDKILYDKYHEAEFARYDLGIYLPKLYSENSDLIVAVLCPAYSKKRWTGWEWQHIYSLLTQTDGHRVMPCRFEYAMADGLTKAAAFVELDEKTPAQLADLILKRLALNDGLPPEAEKPPGGQTTASRGSRRGRWWLALAGALLLLVLAAGAMKLSFHLNQWPQGRRSTPAPSPTLTDSLALTLTPELAPKPSLAPDSLPYRVLDKWEQQHPEIPRLNRSGVVPKEFWYQFYELGLILYCTSGEPKIVLLNFERFTWRKVNPAGPLVAEYHRPKGAPRLPSPNKGVRDKLLALVPDPADRPLYHEMLEDGRLSGGTGTVYVREQLLHEFGQPTSGDESRVTDGLYLPGPFYDLIVNVINRGTDPPDSQTVRAVFILYHESNEKEGGRFEKFSVQPPAAP